MPSRRQSREYAFQMLFQRDLGGSGSAPDDVSRTFWDGKEEDEEVKAFADALATGTVMEIDFIDDVIRGQAQHWRLERMAAVDRNILRLAVYELLQGVTPPAVVINEAIEVARKFSGEESTQFVNGILDGVRKEMLKEPGTK